MFIRRMLLALVLMAGCTLALQLALVLRIALMAWLDPQSTTFQRSEIWRLVVEKRQVAWSQRWAGYDDISVHLKRAVIAAEDAGFTEHSGADWDAMEQAWGRNQRAAARAARSAREPRLRGGSTITQQLAKNLLLSGERTVVRKGQELVLAWALELLLDKRRILEIYLNNVEWGEGLFGAQAAARHYFRTDASRLSPAQAARLAVMLPAPKRFERQPASGYLLARAATIQARMPAVVIP
ncbi:monofunctional biosynthetic peptidoglycan transglycosylase [Pseudorhodoferax sp.]|uniref:monofunctional biosynthetic peptidoglycan transglycosylase n=1 Tax=Pseudorhodoferax sp. TaxID=1993553 RepID=UPI002DD68F56|nr:monofunctional biosynthetic peptidoglycan transglycosylase [Pseudorhodoferax sp.]